MKSREEIRREYYHKKRVRKTALMFFYALSIAGAGFIFQDEIQTAYQKVDDAISQTQQKQLMMQQGQTVNQGENMNPASVSMQQNNSYFQDFVVDKSAVDSNVNEVKSNQSIEGLTQNDSRSQNNPTGQKSLEKSIAETGQNAPEVMDQTQILSSLNVQSGTVKSFHLDNKIEQFKFNKDNQWQAQLDDEQAYKMFNQLFEAMTYTAPVSSKSGLTSRLTNLQDNKDNLLNTYSKQLEAVSTAFTQGSLDQDAINSMQNTQEKTTSGNVPTMDEALPFSHMNFKTIKGTIKKGASFSRDGYSFVESAQKSGVSKEDVTFITHALAGDVELGKMVPGDIFKIVTGIHKESNTEEIVSIILTVKGKEYQRFAWTDEKGERNLYTPEGVRPTKEIMKFPVEFHKYVSSPFGIRKHPTEKDKLGKRITRMHKGVDLALPTGTPIKAAADGIVTYAGWGNGYGNYVEIKHKNGYTTRYAHLSRFEKGLKSGTKVKAGQNIAKGGSTGRNSRGQKISTGSHLHFEVRINGTAVNPLLDHKLEGSKTLEQGKMKEFLAFVDTVRMDSLDIPSKARHLKGILAHATQPTATDRLPETLLIDPSFRQNILTVRNKDRLSNTFQNKSRIPLFSFSHQKKKGNGA